MVADREAGPVRPGRTAREPVATAEHSATYPEGPAHGQVQVVPRTQVMSGADVARALTRLAHEVVEHNRGVEGVVLVGLQTGGVPIASRLRSLLEEIAGTVVPIGTMDVSMYRDDIALRPVMPAAATDLPMDLSGTTVVLVDDVIFTGRTVRAALGALSDYGRAAAVQLAVMVDRGHRELPIRPDFVGKNLPTRSSEIVEVSLGGVTIGEILAAGGL